MCPVLTVRTGDRDTFAVGVGLQNALCLRIYRETERLKRNRKIFLLEYNYFSLSSIKIEEKKILIKKEIGLIWEQPSKFPSV